MHTHKMFINYSLGKQFSHKYILLRSTVAGYNFLKMISRKFSLFSTRLSLLRAENQISDDAFTPE